MFEHISSAGPIKRFFMTCVEDNAGRACRSEPPLTYDECLLKWSTVNRAKYGVSEEASRKRSHEESYDLKEKDDFTSAVKGFTQALANFSKGKTQEPSPKKNKKKLFCKFYNKPGGCPNTQSGKGCIGPDRTFYFHTCDMRVQPGNKICGKEHCASDHV